MGEQREKLLASRSAALAAKEAFTSQYAAGRPDRAVGLGVNRSGDDWAVKVFAQTPSAAEELPDHFGAFDVEVEITGQVKIR
ncbi:hypothetical protein ASG40_04195 [Methylobacterium sp. Leaf399]|uniref:hypothetical protein n=1 Tax=unclassified Methylobacterium TaxID=2615210 RepID=UPI0006FF9106|nr:MULTISPECIES: hypothetical protein [unclassified Methylobacterium]KQP61674.1 hypothetical protein ASF39_03110 [Methylobacterium sp. Leaf108]KQT20004.1 hypothetical protein ASG40_04195 [Methylobacterium sp. Leaf399]KQT78521.1 hypothetical protein ASG59_08625 [Methylobacterium sp. Leaf466]